MELTTIWSPTTEDAVLSKQNQRQWAIGQACTSPTVLSVFSFGLIFGIAGCASESPMDFCSANHDERGVLASGEVRVIADAGNAPSPSSSFTSYAFLHDPHSIRLAGCAVDAKNMLWDYRSIWAFPESGATFPLDVRSPSVLEDAPAPSHAVLLADCLHCSAEVGCYDAKESVFSTDPHPWSTTDTHNPAMGTVDVFDVVGGRFKAYVTVGHKIGKISRMYIDVSWPPSAFTFPADDTGGDFAANDNADPAGNEP